MKTHQVPASSSLPADAQTDDTIIASKLLRRSNIVRGTEASGVPSKGQHQSGQAVATMPAIPIDEPAWQRAFIAADGVRFTRTPDTIMRRRLKAAEVRADEELAPEPAASTPPDTPALVEPQPLPRHGARPSHPSRSRLDDLLPNLSPRSAADATDEEPAVVAHGSAEPDDLSVTGVLFTNYGMMLGSGLTGMNVFWNSPFWMGPVPVEERASPASSADAEEPQPRPSQQGRGQADRVATVEAVDLDGVDPGYVWLYVDQQASTPAPVPEPSEASKPEAGRVSARSITPRRIVEAPALRVAEPPVAPPARAPLADLAGADETELGYELPHIEYLAEPPEAQGPSLTDDVLEDTAGRLEKVIRDFGVKGDVIHVRPGPVVTLYELEPAPGTKSSRVMALSDDIARSMSAVSTRVAVIPGRNAIGIELPNQTRETVYLRELLSSQDFESTKQKLPLCLGKTIGGEPVIADLARMPHLLVAGTTGSGKSVAINTMILSLLYRFRPEECRLIMVDPKMLELSVYDGIPHLLTPVVTDPKKAIIALRWAVREMEDRYKKMSKLGVRNIDGFNARVAEAKARGEVITRTVQTGFDRETGEAVYEDEVMDLDPLPYIVVIVDEMADLMMVAGKDIEGAIQRLAQMARAAGIHVILATQRPSVDVITGTIKANFPTRISFQVTSKIDSRTILGEMGAEQLLGQGDMLYMAGGGRITRVHGPFCSDEEVEKVVAHLKRQGKPVYLEAVTADEEAEMEPEEVPVFDETDSGLGPSDLYEQAVAVVMRHKKASTSYIQRRLQIGYNRAASLMERMEKEGIVGPANHAGKRDILADRMDD